MDWNVCLLSGGRGTKSILCALENGAGSFMKMKNTGLKIMCTYVSATLTSALCALFCLFLSIYWYH